MEHDSMDRKLSVLLCGALTLALAGCQAPVEEPLLDPTVTVETTAVQAGDLSTQSTYIGTISAEGTASVVSMISGNVEQVRAKLPAGGGSPGDSSDENKEGEGSGDENA